jgi:hypothetical protein
MAFYDSARALALALSLGPLLVGCGTAHNSAASSELLPSTASIGPRALAKLAPLYVANGQGPSTAILEFAVPSAKGQSNPAPIRTITNVAGFGFLQTPYAMSVDHANNLLVADTGHVLVYPPGSNGPTLPLMPPDFYDGNGQMGVALGVDVDAGNRVHIVGVNGSPIPGAPRAWTFKNGQGQVPLDNAFINNDGSSSEDYPVAIVIAGAALQYTVVSDLGSDGPVSDGRIAVYPLNVSGQNPIPICIIHGSKARIGVTLRPTSLAYRNGIIWVAGRGNGGKAQTILGFAKFSPPGSGCGDIKPDYSLGGSNTGLTDIAGLSVDANGTLWVANNAAQSSALLGFAAGNQQGNAVPNYKITGSHTLLTRPYAIR